MSKNQKNKKSEPEQKTDTTDTENTENSENNDIENKKSNKKFNLSKKAKLYIGIAIVLLIIGVYLWYKNKKNKGLVQQNNGVVQTTNVLPPTPNVPAQSVVVTNPDF